MGGLAIAASIGRVNRGCVKVNVFFLCRPDDGDEGIDVGFQAGIFLDLNGIGSVLDNLIDVGIIESELGQLIACQQVGRPKEVIDPAVSLHSRRSAAR